MTTASAPSLNLSGRIPELDGLRGLAILLVIFCHYIGNAGSAPLGFWLHRFFLAFTVGWSGVDLFFVLSGFLIGGILLEARNTPHYFRAFYMRRVFRILPIYYLWTLLFAITIILALNYFPGRFGIVSSDLLRVPVQLLFLQNFFIGMPRFTWIWFVVTWSLAVEEQFYLVAPPLIRFLSLRKFVALLAATVILAPLLRFMLFRYWAPDTYLCTYLMPCRADALACGMLLAVAWRNARCRQWIDSHAALLRRSLSVLFLGVGGLLWWLVHPVNAVTVTIGLTWLALFYSLLLLVAVSQPAGFIASVMRSRFLGWLGGISYCVYILHDALNFFAHAIFFRAEPQIYTLGGVAVSVLAILATLALASLSWHFFEKPLIKIGHTWSYSSPSSTGTLACVPFPSEASRP
jgi:peptidoglycan/LPS O-acetylase OafA/YrhL